MKKGGGESWVVADAGGSEGFDCSEREIEGRIKIHYSRNNIIDGSFSNAGGRKFSMGLILGEAAIRY